MLLYNRLIDYVLYGIDLYYNLIFRYWWARLSILAKQEDWNELEKLSKIKKSPIGYEVKKTRLNLI